MKPTPFLLISALLVGISLTACSTPTPTTTEPGTSQEPVAASYVTDGTFVMPITSDPGALDPQMSISASVFEMSGFAYDTIVGTNPAGEILPQLAKSWTYEGQSATFTLNEGVTCSDGSALTAKTVADNINWVEDVNNESPFLGSFLPVGITATADTAANTVSLELAAPVPFLLEALTNFPIVCDAGLANRTQLNTATLGSGPYQLSEAVPDDHYTYTRRDGYTWGANGATTAEPGLPKTVTFRVVPNESTAVNMLLSGEVNAVLSIGPDAARAQAAGLKAVDVPAILGLTWYNHAEGHPGADPAVRMALTQAVNLEELAKVITANEGGLAKALSILPPATCDYDSTTGNLPAFDVAAAEATLTTAGYSKGADGKWGKDGTPLALTFLYDSGLGTTGTAAAELAIQQWEAAGFTIEPTALDTTRLSEIIFGTGDWDITWVPINLNGPDQLMSYVSGPSVADGGANFSSISNPDYDAAATAAQTKIGDEACQGFATAEASLVKSADFIPWAQRPNKVYYSGVEYQYLGRTDVMALRMLAQ